MTRLARGRSSRFHGSSGSFYLCAAGSRSTHSSASFLMKSEPKNSDRRPRLIDLSSKCGTALHSKKFKETASARGPMNLSSISTDPLHPHTSLSQSLKVSQSSRKKWYFTSPATKRSVMLDIFERWKLV